MSVPAPLPSSSQAYSRLPFFEYSILVYIYLYLLDPTRSNFYYLVAAVIVGSLVAAFVKLTADMLVREVKAGKLTTAKAMDLKYITKRTFGRSNPVGIPMIVVAGVAILLFARSLWVLSTSPLTYPGIILLVVGLGILVATLFIPVYFSRITYLLWRWVRRGRRY